MMWCIGVLIFILLIIIVIKIFNAVINKYMQKQIYHTLTELLNISDIEANIIFALNGTEDLMKILKVIIETINMIGMGALHDKITVYEATEKCLAETIYKCKNNNIFLDNSKEILIQKVIYNYLSTVIYNNKE